MLVCAPTFFFIHSMSTTLQAATTFLITTLRNDLLLALNAVLLLHEPRISIYSAHILRSG